MMPIKQTDIVVIGNADLVNELRLAGISRYHLIRDEHDAAGEVRQALTNLISEPDVGVIVISEDYAEYVGDLLAQARAGKRMVPVIVEVPTKHGTKYGDVREYYKAYIRKFIGFDIEI